MLMSVKADRESLKIQRRSNYRRHIKGSPRVCPQTDELIRAMAGVSVTGTEAGIHPGRATSTAQALCLLTLSAHTVSIAMFTASGQVYGTSATHTHTYSSPFDQHEMRMT